MKRMDWMRLGPSIVVALGMVAGMWVATHASSQGMRMLGGMAVVAVVTLLANVWNRRLRGGSARPSWVALGVVAVSGGASAILMDGDAGTMRTLIPTFGILGWMTLQGRTEAKCLAPLSPATSGEGR